MIKFGDSGNALVYALAGPRGRGTRRCSRRSSREILGMDPDKIALRASDPDGPALVGNGTISSRSMMSHGGAMVFAAREVIRKGLDLAAKDLEVAPQDIEFEAGRYRVKGTDLSVTLEAIVAKKHAQRARFDGRDSGAARVPERRARGRGGDRSRRPGEIEILRYTAVDDCGRVLNHTLLEGQIHGGIVQGIGQVIGEHCDLRRASGQLLTGSFMDYSMPRADACATCGSTTTRCRRPSNPLGVTGAGEAGTTGAVPTLANAVLDALRPLGIEHLDFPYTAARVWEAIVAASAGRRTGA